MKTKVLIHSAADRAKTGGVLRFSDRAMRVREDGALVNVVPDGKGNLVRPLKLNKKQRRAMRILAAADDEQIRQAAMAAGGR